MIRFARLLGASAIGAGIGIGLILCLSLNPLVRPTSGGTALPVALPAARAPLAIATDPCASPISNVAEVQTLFELHCAVHSAVFDDGDWPSIVYTFEDPVASPGLHDGVNHEDKDVVLDAVYVVEADLENEAPDLFAVGATVHMVIGTLEGAAGAIPVAGVAMYNVTDDDDYILLVVAILSSADLADYSHAAAIAQGVMVQEEGDGFGPTTPPYPLATATAVPENLWAYESDLSVLYGDGTATGDPECARLAEIAYDDARRQADNALGVCLSGVALGLSVCLGACAGGAVLGPIGWGAAAVCAAWCVAGAAAAAVICKANHLLAIQAAGDALRLAYLACGYTIVVD